MEPWGTPEGKEEVAEENVCDWTVPVMSTQKHVDKGFRTIFSDFLLTQKKVIFVISDQTTFSTCLLCVSYLSWGKQERWRLSYRKDIAYKRTQMQRTLPGGRFHPIADAKAQYVPAGQKDPLRWYNKTKTLSVDSDGLNLRSSLQMYSLNPVKKGTAMSELSFVT